MLRPPHTRYFRIYTYHLDGLGAAPVNDPDLIGIWEEDGKTILIFHRPKEELVAELCRRHSCRLFYRADLDYDDWETGSAIVPFTVGPLTIAPVWNPRQADIVLDPSVVFGSGFHPSTRLSLEALVKHHTKLPRQFRALDLGCGTGLLAISAAKLGASSAAAVDHNPLACEVSKQNAINNNVEDIVRVSRQDLREKIPATDVDVVMANLHHELLAELFGHASFWKARLYILTGFMPGAEENLLLALPASPPPFVERLSLDKWRGWVLGNP